MKNLCKKITNRWWKKAIVGILVLVVVSQAWGALYNNVINVKPYEQQVVLITGTASGIGEATAKHLIEQGHIVYGGDIQFEKNRWLDEAGGHALDMDVTSSTMVAAGVQRVIDEQGRIDVLFNNAGYGLNGTVEDASLEDVRAQFEVNVFGYAQLLKEVLLHMRAQKSGLVINNSSMGGRMYFPLGAWYHASKHAVEAMSDALRFELMPYGIDVVLVEPGLIDTNFSNVSGQYTLKYAAETDYDWLYQPAIETFEAADRELYDDPIVIAETVEEIMRAKNPKHRYLRGSLSGFLVHSYEWGGTRFYDLLMRRLFLGSFSAPVIE